MGEKFPAVLLNHLHAQTSSAGLCNVRLSFSFLGHLSCKAQKKLLEHMLTITAPIFSPHGKNSTSMHPSPSHNTVPVVLETEGIAFGLLFLHNVVDAIPNSPVLFLDQSDETSFHYPSQCCKESHHLQQHTVPANVRKYFFG